MTIDNIQTAILKGKTVIIRNHNENTPLTVFKVYRDIITIEAGNVRRFKIGALDYFLSHTVIY